MIVKIELEKHYNSLPWEYFIDIGDKNFDDLIREFYVSNNLEDQFNDEYCNSNDPKVPQILSLGICFLKNVSKHFNDFETFLLSKGCKKAEIKIFKFSD